jgi:hypothetical protein
VRRGNRRPFSRLGSETGTIQARSTNNYRFGRTFLHSLPLDCADDTEAMKQAKRLVGGRGWMIPATDKLESVRNNNLQPLVAGLRPRDQQLVDLVGRQKSKVLGLAPT